MTIETIDFILGKILLAAIILYALHPLIRGTFRLLTDSDVYEETGGWIHFGILLGILYLIR